MTTVPQITDSMHPPHKRSPLPHSAGGLPVTWRPLRARDAGLLMPLLAAVDRNDHPTARHDRSALSRTLRSPGFTPHTDGVIALDPAGTALAYGACVTELPHPEAHLPSGAFGGAPQGDHSAAPQSEHSGGSQIEHGGAPEPHVAVHLEGAVHPRVRGSGIGRALLAWQEWRGRQLLTGIRTTLPALLTTHANRTATSAARLYAAAGYAPVREWRTMRRALGSPLPQLTVPDGIRIRPFSLRFSEATRIALNDAFRDHWGFTPVSAREWRRIGHNPLFVARLSRLAISGSGTLRNPHRVAGFVLSEVNRAEWPLHGQRVGRLDAIGVVSDWRGTGLSRPLITSALAAHQRNGHTSVDLDVDAENPSGAHTLYERLGFVEHDGSTSFAKRVTHSPAELLLGPAVAS
ncbi:GNAT family N-acetyltransferase [Leucobacter luti]|uniref:GNAT family N-acetyltransferase n=1 Tax=Leucobacter luti TaxID=340320 RepID=UPI001C68C276|nr:GNAT family N-acetyltransferase [Leucobacter luti]QYM76827.1 GNAT family N-acetyltransferase [Leucobacter luti]